MGCHSSKVVSINEDELERLKMEVVEARQLVEDELILQAVRKKKHSAKAEEKMKKLEKKLENKNSQLNQKRQADVSSSLSTRQKAARDKQHTAPPVKKAREQSKTTRPGEIQQKLTRPTLPESDGETVSAAIQIQKMARAKEARLRYRDDIRRRAEARDRITGRDPHSWHESWDAESTAARINSSSKSW